MAYVLRLLGSASITAPRMLQTTLIAVLLAGLAGLASFALWQGHRIRGTAARERGAEDRVVRVLAELATAPDRARVFDLALDELAALRRETDCAVLRLR
jgi:hypothetical protein